MRGVSCSSDFSHGVSDLRRYLYSRHRRDRRAGRGAQLSGWSCPSASDRRRLMHRGISQVRRATSRDIEGILALEALFPGDRMTRRSLARLVRSPTASIWVACSRKVPSDCVQAALVLLIRRNTRVARVYSLAVAPAVRGQGLATALVETAQRWATDAGKLAISLEVRCDNLAARALYQRLGYTPVSALSGYYDDGGDGIRLQKKLSRRPGARV